MLSKAIIYQVQFSCWCIIDFSPDVILCSWLGSQHQPTKYHRFLLAKLYTHQRSGHLPGEGFSKYLLGKLWSELNFFRYLGHSFLSFACSVDVFSSFILSWTTCLLRFSEPLISKTTDSKQTIEWHNWNKFIHSCKRQLPAHTKHSSAKNSILLYTSSVWTRLKRHKTTWVIMYTDDQTHYFFQPLIFSNNYTCRQALKQNEGGLSLDAVGRDGEVVFQWPSATGQLLVVGWNPLFLLDFFLHLPYGVWRFHFKGHETASICHLYEDLLQ